MVISQQQGTQWVFAMDENKLKENAMSVAYPKGLPVLLIKKEGRVYALSNKCAHMACSLSGGSLHGFMLRCPCHDWLYDIRTGQFFNAPEIRLTAYESKVEGGKIYVKVGGPA
jgi:nitrite reductase/ring-hydroxylating ferredoxin subunit